MKYKISFINKLKVCWNILLGKSGLEYIIDLEQRCLKSNVAPFETTNETDGIFQWNIDSIENMEEWLKHKNNE